MTSADRHVVSSRNTARVPRRSGPASKCAKAGCPWASRLAFWLVAAGLAAAGGVGVLTAARASQWDRLPRPDSSNYLDLDQINKSNVNRLQVAWFYPYGAAIFSPVFADGVLYGLGRNGSSLIALDATTGKEIWIHEGLNGITSKGINYWQSADGKDRRLIFAVNSFLQAIDARTGKSILTFGDNGISDMRVGLRRAEGTSARAMPASPGRIWKNLLILGGQSGEAFLTPPGDIRAYDVITGKPAWQFHTVPPPGEFGYETNPKDGYKYIGGANNWGEMSIDEERGIVYIPTGSATYDFYGADRHGANLFANCLLALDARTGKRLWHFQTIHHDLWDLDNVSAPQLVTVRHGGRRIDAVAHAGKTGFLYVFNRVTGEPLWPIEERSVMKSDVPGEYSAPTQPFPTKPPPFGRQSFTIDDVNPWLLTPERYEATRDRVAKARNGTGPQGGLFVPPGVGIDAVSMPGNQGGSNWGTTAANPRKGLVFVVGVNQVALLRLEDVKTREAGAGRGGVSGSVLAKGQAAYRQYCQACHGADLRGAMPDARTLVGVTDRMDPDAIRAIVQEGQGLMRPILDIDSADMTAVIEYLTNTNPFGRGGGGRGRGAGAGPPLPPGPVVASGGAPQPPLPARGTGPFYPGVGGSAGNFPWPDDVEAKNLPTRYMSGYNVMATATTPPYTTLTAYDLNTGEIKWQIAPGDHPPTVAAGGPKGTGGVGARNGILVTKTGLVFHAAGDGKIRAYDEDTGEELWAGAIPGPARGIPAMYMARGRQYLVVAAPGGASAGGGGAADPDPDQTKEQLSPDTPRGYIAFALPRR